MRLPIISLLTTIGLSACSTTGIHQKGPNLFVLESLINYNVQNIKAIQRGPQDFCKKEGKRFKVVSERFTPVQTGKSVDMMDTHQIKKPLMTYYLEFSCD